MVGMPKGTVEDYKLAWSALMKLAAKTGVYKGWDNIGWDMFDGVTPLSQDELDALLRLGVVKEGQVY